ncbi:hypothetical protein PCCS19_03660 [Paenibacillus sp. CCS19]|uniref:hypothetical protein n=1 Tax=Paenibacillus sp. CCS19 TaxID=3158387 RepID=UPI00255DABFF|nr:hypothetical protein [Paenibacillus cellulosilyticus]GMK37313.1 hypothetical protein PCCS19_03660 [Paenibacillus cellulosilyticus]
MKLGRMVSVLIKVWVSILIMFALIGCKPNTTNSLVHREPVITGNVTSIKVTTNFKSEQTARITDQVRIDRITQSINEAKREDVSDVVMEIGPDARMMFYYGEEVSTTVSFFSDRPAFGVFWSHEGHTYFIDTNFTLKDLFN